jgi:ankyrin repeat protein
MWILLVYVVQLYYSAWWKNIDNRSHGNDVSYCLQIVEYLLDMAEVKADAHDTLTGETALTVAASNGCHSACAALLLRGASVSAVNRKVSSKR